MLRTMEERSGRQAALKERNEEELDPKLLTLKYCAQIMNCSRGTAWRIFRHEPGVKIVLTPGSHRPMVRVPREVFERVMRRSANPWRS